MRTLQRVYLRADGSSTIGLGHLVRLSALANMLKNNFHTCFLLKESADEFRQQILSGVDEIISIPDFENNILKESTFLQQHIISKNDLVVLDGYHFNTAYQSEIKAKGCKLVCIDDIHAHHFVADAVINHAPGILKEQYSCEPYTRLYLGSEYVLLKKIFLQKAISAKQTFDFNESPILICLGGADPKNMTIKVAKKVRELLPDKQIFLIVGGAYQYKNTLEDICKSDTQLSLFVNSSSEELVTLMDKAHIAITSASTIALEYICAKGNLFLIVTASNQMHLYKSLIERMCAYPFELLPDYYNSTGIIDNQYELIDGKSDERILKIFTELSGSQ
jgi:UDP-2,4-diacetamido-2,4,6-trideoxy-beta-L-altropyranose hydrolase